MYVATDPSTFIDSRTDSPGFVAFCRDHGVQPLFERVGNPHANSGALWGICMLLSCSPTATRPRGTAREGPNNPIPYTTAQQIPAPPRPWGNFLRFPASQGVRPSSAVPLAHERPAPLNPAAGNPSTHRSTQGLPLRRHAPQRIRLIARAQNLAVSPMVV